MRTRTAGPLPLLLLVLSLSPLAYSAGPFSPPEGKALYAVTADIVPEDFNGRSKHGAEVFRLSQDTEAPKLEPIHTFHDIALVQFHNFEGARVVVLLGHFWETTDNSSICVRAFSYGQPWDIRSHTLVKFDPDDGRVFSSIFSDNTSVSHKSFFEKSGTAYFVHAYIYEPNKRGVDVFELPSMAPQDIPQEQWYYPGSDEPLEPGAPWKIGWRFENLIVPLPAEAILKRPTRADTVSVGLHHLLLKDFVPEPWVHESANSVFAYLDRAQEKWYRFTEKGNLTAAKVVGPWIAFRIAWLNPYSFGGGPIYTGEWILVSPQTGAEQSILLHRNSDILMATQDALFMRSDNALIHCPIRKSGPHPVDIGQASVLYRGEEVRFVKALFLGPNTDPTTTQPSLEGRPKSDEADPRKEIEQ